MAEILAITFFFYQCGENDTSFATFVVTIKKRWTPLPEGMLTPG
jgi:hypothetical protein